MKKTLILLGVVMMSLQAVASAPTPPDHAAAVNARATVLTRNMARTMLLDESQYVKIKKLNVQMLTEMDDLKARFSADPELLDEHMADVQLRYETSLLSLLRTRQIAAYQQARTSMTALNLTAN